MQVALSLERLSKLEGILMRTVTKSDCITLKHAANLSCFAEMESELLTVLIEIKIKNDFLNI